MNLRQCHVYAADRRVFLRLTKQTAPSSFSSHVYDTVSHRCAFSFDLFDAAVSLCTELRVLNLSLNFSRYAASYDVVARQRRSRVIFCMPGGIPLATCYAADRRVLLTYFRALTSALYKV